MGDQVFSLQQTLIDSKELRLWRREKVCGLNYWRWGAHGVQFHMYFSTAVKLAGTDYQDVDPIK